MISFGFFVMFTSFLACQNSASKIMEDLGFSSLGLISISMIYFSFACTAMFANSIDKVLGTKMTLFFASLSYAFWIASFLFPAYKY